MGRRTHLLQTAALALWATAAPGAVLAQSAAPGATLLERIIVTGSNNSLERRAAALPGGAAVLSAEDTPASANLTLSQALKSVPGVVVQDFFGGNDQPRVQIRGSGLQQNPVERGVLVLQDGLPINRADGSYVVGFANPAQAEAMEVYRGYLANRLGATVLGGAMNLISPTGATAPGGRLSASGGSFEQVGASGQYGVAEDRHDLLVQADITSRDGYRAHNESRRVSLGANAGFELSEHVSLRVFADYSDLRFDVAGPLTRTLLESDPESVFTGPTITPNGAINPGPNVVRDRPQRDSEFALLGARATGTFGAHILDGAFGYSHTDDSFGFPISAGIRETEGDDVTGVFRYAYKPDANADLPLFEATAQYAAGEADRAYYWNLAGEKGQQFGDNELDAETLSVSAGFHIPVGPSVTISPSLSYSYASRDNADVYAQPTRPTAAYNPGNPTMRLPDGAVPAVSASYAHDYEGWSPALGVSWRLDGGGRLFAALSRSFEPPTHDDLLATVNGTPNSTAGRPNPGNPAMPAAAFATPDLEAQRATTLEGGWRGRAGPLSLDAVAYYSWVEDELLSLRDVTGASLGAVNADDTRHFGIELGLTADITPRLTGRVAYTYQDFHFHDDPVRGDKDLAGAPPHTLHATLRYAITANWSAQTGVSWMVEKTPVDNMNTLYRDPYAVVDLRSEYQVSDTLSVFGEVTNLFDETYASSSLIVDQARRDQAAFLPGDGRGFFAGARLAF